jgi:signal transduction histidine kinase
VGLDRPLSLRVAIAWHDGLEVVVEDDGVGLDDRDEPAGGQGLALHSTMLAVVGGTLTLDSAPGRYTRAMISLPEGSGDRQHDLQKATAS